MAKKGHFVALLRKDSVDSPEKMVRAHLWSSKKGNDVSRRVVPALRGMDKNISAPEQDMGTNDTNNLHLRWKTHLVYRRLPPWTRVS